MTGVRDEGVIGGGGVAMRLAAAARSSAEERRKQTLRSRDAPRLSSRGRETRPSAPACGKRSNSGRGPLFVLEIRG